MTLDLLHLQMSNETTIWPAATVGRNFEPNRWHGGPVFFVGKKR
jgi:hypothetical protein